MKTCKRQINAFHIPKGLWMWMTVVGLFLTGCEDPAAQNKTIPQPMQDFTIRKVRISALSDFVLSRDNSGQNQIKTCVELLDAYNSPLKKPCIFRFELYDYKPMSANPRGKRLVIWPDIDLTDPAKNNEYWKDYIRAYEFYLPLGFVPQPDHSYLLEATCLTVDQRFSGVLKIRCRP